MALRDVLGEPEFDAAWAEGAALSTTVDVGTDGPALLSKTAPVGHEAEQNLNTDGPPRAVDGVALATPF